MTSNIFLNLFLNQPSKPQNLLEGFLKKCQKCHHLLEPETLKTENMVRFSNLRQSLNDSCVL